MPILDATLRYAGHGWPVFPCAARAKVPAIAGGHGVHDATTDPARITRWWSERPDRNVAIATGAPGPDVLDVDVHGDATGIPALQRLYAAGLIPEATAAVRTPSGGMHLYFAGSDQGNGTLARHHIDFRARGGYVVAPPSVVNGTAYVLEAHQTVRWPIDWSAIRAFLEPPRLDRQRAVGGPKSLGHLIRVVEELQPGNRNGGLFWAACRAAEDGLLTAEGIEALVNAAVQSGLRGGEPEARRTITSAIRSAARSPAVR
jgi:hypothetical protein